MPRVVTYRKSVDKIREKCHVVAMRATLPRKICKAINYSGEELSPTSGKRILCSARCYLYKWVWSPLLAVSPLHHWCVVDILTLYTKTHRILLVIILCIRRSVYLFTSNGWTSMNYNLLLRQNTVIPVVRSAAFCSTSLTTPTGSIVVGFHAHESVSKS